jgi:NADPH-dependent 2,4-dienoyl-CoA reductase/sulfur reductase-like enzyme
VSGGDVRLREELIVVVGGGAAGISAVQALRREGYEDRVTLVGDEVHMPYDRPPLSKQILAGEWEPERAGLIPPARLEGLDAELLLGTAAASLDVAAHRLTLADERTIAYSSIVLATGVHPRALFGHDVEGVVVLRTMPQALELQALLREPGRRLVVVGGGFLGLEVAATASKMGAEVIVVEPVPGPPLASRIGPIAAPKLADLHRERGVEVRTGVGVAAVETDAGTIAVGEPAGAEPSRRARVRAVALTDGSVLEADVVLVAIGSSPAVGWLAGSGVELDDGIVCDEFCAAGDDVWAAGDIARWLHLGLDRRVRLEHRTNANEQATAVAANLLGGRRPYTPVPFFWTDQHGTKIQLAGFMPPDAEVEVVEGAADSDSFVQEIRQADRLVGVLGWNAGRALGKRRGELQQQLGDPAMTPIRMEQ